MPPKNVLQLGSRAVNIGNLCVVEVPVDFQLVPDVNKPSVAVFLTIERLCMSSDMLTSQVMLLSAVLQTLIEEVKPGLVAQLMTKQLAEPKPEREILITMLKALENNVQAHMKHAVEIAAANPPQKKPEM